MSPKEHLCVILIEELSEMQKEISKGLRFGFDTIFENVSQLSVKERVNVEWHDINTVLQMLSEDHCLTMNAIYNHEISEKRQRIKQMMDKSKFQGLIQ